MAINFPNNPAVNDTFTVGGTKFTFTGDKWESGAVVEFSSDTTPQLSGELNAGTHNINNVGVITATAFHGDGSNLTGLTDAAANTYGNATAVPQIVVGANGRITGISNVSISGGGGGGGSSIILKDNQSLVGAAGTIDFGTNLSVSAISAGVATVTAAIAGINTSGTSEFNNLDVDGHTELDNVNISGVTTTGAVSWGGHMLPTSDSVYDIGSADYKIRHIFVSDNSLKFIDSSDVEHPLSVDSGRLKFGGGLLLGNTIKADTTSGIVTATSFSATGGTDAIGIQSGGLNISTGIITALNFVGAGNTFSVNGSTVDISIAAGSDLVIVDGGDFNSSSSIAGASSEINGGEFT